MAVRWLSDGRPVVVRWPSGDCPMAVRWLSDGRPAIVRWPSGGCPMAVRRLASSPATTDDVRRRMAAFCGAVRRCVAPIGGGVRRVCQAGQLAAVFLRCCAATAGAGRPQRKWPSGALSPSVTRLRTSTPRRRRRRRPRHGTEGPILSDHYRTTVDHGLIIAGPRLDHGESTLDRG